MPKMLRWYDTITFNIYWLGLSTLSNTMTPLVLPLLVQQFVGNQDKATFYGTLRLGSLMVALLVQALMGMLSDRSTLRFGRRRPFIFIGTLFDLVIILLIGFSAGLSGISGYWILFALMVLLSISSNTAQGAQQAFIPDLVPDNQRGLFSGVKAVLEVPLPLILISFTIGRLISAGKMWFAILLVMGILTIAMIVTMFVREKPLIQSPSPLKWDPFLRLVLMAALFTLIILGMGELVKWGSQLTTGITSTSGIFLTIGPIGLLAMVVAIAVGVWISIRVGLGGSDGKSRNPSFTWWVVNRLAYLVGVGNLASFTVYFLQARLGYVREAAAGPASMLIMFVGVFILLSALPSGWLADRFGHKRLVAVSGIVGSVGTLIVILAPSLPLIYVGGSIIGAATGLFYAANWALGTQLVPQGEAGRYLGISNLAGAGAGAIGAYIGGPIADYVSQQLPGIPGIGYVLLFAIYGLLILGSVFALLGVKSEKPSHLALAGMAAGSDSR
ncbi:MAG: MFS transporter [Chloroflexi bacterium]|nr:MFS transporter [Chloroflexota bacterium]